MSGIFDFSPEALARLADADVARALAEDVGPDLAQGDLTAALVPAGRRALARVLTREEAVICGRPWVDAAIRALDPQARITWHVAEGAACRADEVVLEIEGSARALLTAERTALNFLQVLRAAQAVAPQATFVESEVETLAQLQEALDAGATMVLLDNMDLPTLREAVRINAGRAILEISGGVTLERLRALAETGVDRISVGALTKDVKATDFSMRFKEL